MDSQLLDADYGKFMSVGTYLLELGKLTERAGPLGAPPEMAEGLGYRRIQYVLETHVSGRFSASLRSWVCSAAAAGRAPGALAMSSGSRKGYYLVLYFTYRRYSPSGMHFGILDVYASRLWLVCMSVG